MGLFEKFNKITDKLVNSIEETASDINKTYKSKGLNGFIEQANSNFDSLSQKTKDYYQNIAQNNKDIMRSATPKTLEEKIAAAAAVVVNTTQTIVQDAVNVTVKTAKNVVDTEQVSIRENHNSESTKSTTTKDMADSEKSNTKTTKNSFVSLIDSLDEGQIASLDATPLSIILENMGAALEPRSTDRYKTLENSTIILAHNKWYCFNNGGQGQGAISFVKFALNDEKASTLDNPQEDKILLEQALVVLNEYQKTPNYNTRVSLWIEQENQFSQKKKETAALVNVDTPKATKPRVRKAKKVESTEQISHETPETPTPKRTRKMK